MTPKRGEDLLAGGSLYWGHPRRNCGAGKDHRYQLFVYCDGIGRCRLAMQPKVIAGAAVADVAVSGLARDLADGDVLTGSRLRRRRHCRNAVVFPAANYANSGLFCKAF